MRVGLDCRLTAYTRGGIARYVTELGDALVALAGGPDIVLLESRKDSARSLLSGALLTPPHHPWERWTLPAELIRHRLDVVHFPDHLAPNRFGPRVVVTVHDLAFELFPETHTKESLAYYGRFREGLRRADAVIAVSENTRRELIARTNLTSSMVITVHNGVGRRFHSSIDLEAERRATTKRFSLPHTFVLTVGTLSPRKNLDTLLEAMALLRGRGSHLELAVVGEHGWLYEKTLVRIDRLGLRHAVHILGAVDDGDLAALYRSAALFVFPSLYEGFALPPLEAMASGTPVVASEAGSIPEVTQGAAMLVAPRDAEALATAMSTVLEDGTFARSLRCQGLEQAAKFTWARCARKTAAVYAAVGGSA